MRDPFLKLTIHDKLIDFIYGATYKQLKIQLNEIITRNTIINRHTHLSFVYKGNRYSNDLSAPPKIRNKLSKSLYTDMNLYIKEEQTIQLERSLVSGYIRNVLNYSNSIDYYYALLPDVLHSILQSISPKIIGNIYSEEITEMIKRNQKVIQLIKQRLLLNLLI